jgi:hypothetical protein
MSQPDLRRLLRERAEQWMPTADPYRLAVETVERMREAERSARFGRLPARPSRGLLVAAAFSLVVIVVIGVALFGQVAPYHENKSANGRYFPKPTIAGTKDWQVVQATEVPSLWPPGLLACPGQGVCYGMSTGSPSTFDVSNDFGLTWRFVSTFAGGFAPADLSCSSVADCLMTGDVRGDPAIWATSDGGAHWRTTAVPSLPPGGATTITCGSARCLAFDTQVAKPFRLQLLSSDDAGRNWALSPPLPTNYLPDDIACSGTECYVTGSIVRLPRHTFQSNWVGSLTQSGWSLFKLPSSFKSAGQLLCLSPGRCELLLTGPRNRNSVFTPSGAGRWTQHPMGGDPIGPVGTFTVACHGEACFGLAQPGATQYAIFSNDGGLTWRRGAPALQGYFGSSDDFICTSAVSCVLNVPGPGSLNYLAVTTDFGHSYSVALSPAALTNFGGIACPSAADCVAVGTNDQGGGAAFAGNALTTDGGSRWAPAPFDSLSGGSKVACVGSFCLEVEASSVAYSPDEGARWTASPVAPNLTVYAVGCISSGMCVSAGHTQSGAGPLLAGLAVSIDGGKTWRSDTLLAHVPSTLTGVACSLVRCVAVGRVTEKGRAQALLFSSNASGGDWRAASLPAGIVRVNDVWCSASDACFAVGDTAGTGGSRAPVVLRSVGGSAWSVWSTGPASALASRATLEPTQIACAGSSCLVLVGEAASGASPAVYRVNGPTWTQESLPAPVHTLTGLTCAPPGGSAPVACFLVGSVRSPGPGSVILRGALP